MMTFFVACMLHPEVQKRGRDEIDAAVGRDRLPTFEDRPRLRFVDAMCKELLRWRPVTPLGASDQRYHKRVANTIHKRCSPCRIRRWCLQRILYSKG